MNNDELTQLQAVGDAAERGIADQGWAPIKVLVLAEVITSAGAREVVIALSRDMRCQDTLGLLHYAVARENAGIVRGMLDDDN